MKLSSKTSKFGVLIVLGVLTISFFQNCSKVSFKEIPSENGGLGVVSEVPPDYTDIPVTQLRMVEQRVSSLENQKVDILFIVDNSGSMREEQQGMSDKIAGFMEIIQNLDWQVALTTTDARATTSDLPQDGQFRAFSDGQRSKFIRKGQFELAEAQRLLAQSILVGINGSGDERGIQVARRSVERRTENSDHRAFHRDDSVLIYILISDENECSNGSCIQANSANNPEKVLQYLSQEFGSEKVVKFNSIIKIPNDASCTTAANVGSAYYELSRLTSGIVGSVCSSNYSQILTSLGEKTLELVKSVNLECNPVDRNSDGKSDIEIRNMSGTIQNTGYKLEGRTLIFDQALEVGDYYVRYACVN